MDVMIDIKQIRMTPVSGLWLIDQDWVIWRVNDPLAQACREVIATTYHNGDLSWGYQHVRHLRVLNTIAALLPLIEIFPQNLRKEGTFPHQQSHIFYD